MVLILKYKYIFEPFNSILFIFSKVIFIQKVYIYIYIYYISLHIHTCTYQIVNILKATLKIDISVNIIIGNVCFIGIIAGCLATSVHYSRQLRSDMEDRKLFQ